MKNGAQVAENIICANLVESLGEENIAWIHKGGIERSLRYRVGLILAPVPVGNRKVTVFPLPLIGEGGDSVLVRNDFGHYLKARAGFVVLKSFVAVSSPCEIFVVLRACILSGIVWGIWYLSQERTVGSHDNHRTNKVVAFHILIYRILLFSVDR